MYVLQFAEGTPLLLLNEIMELMENMKVVMQIDIQKPNKQLYLLI